MNDTAPSQPPLSSGPEKPSSGGDALIKWCLLIGVITLVLAPVATLKIAEWKIKQDAATKAEMAANGVKTDNLNFGGPFSLVNQDGIPVTDATYRGKYLLVYFGYTYCPDLCPTALQNITETVEELGLKSDDLRVLFITVDPERDLPAKLKDYVASFHPNIAGLTGAPDQVAAVAKAYGVTYKKAETVDDGNYVMDHTTLMYVLDKSGKPLASMDMEQVDPQIIADILRKLWRLPKPKQP